MLSSDRPRSLNEPQLIEDCKFPGGERVERWDAMNGALRTTEETWGEVTQASTRARHLHPENLLWLGDGDRRERLLGQMRGALRAFIDLLGVRWMKKRYLKYEAKEIERNGLSH